LISISPKGKEEKEEGDKDFVFISPYLLKRRRLRQVKSAFSAGDLTRAEVERKSQRVLCTDVVVLYSQALQ